MSYATDIRDRILHPPRSSSLQNSNGRLRCTVLVEGGNHGEWWDRPSTGYSACILGDEAFYGQDYDQEHWFLRMYLDGTVIYKRSALHQSCLLSRTVRSIEAIINAYCYQVRTIHGETVNFRREETIIYRKKPLTRTQQTTPQEEDFDTFLRSKYPEGGEINGENSGLQVV